jgi:hypothetical protein
MEEQLFASVMDAAREKKIAKVISFSFETWILKTIQSFGLESLFAEKLTEKLLLFDPSLVPFEFRPKEAYSEDARKNVQLATGGAKASASSTGGIEQKPSTLSLFLESDHLRRFAGRSDRPIPLCIGLGNCSMIMFPHTVSIRMSGL